MDADPENQLADIPGCYGQDYCHIIGLHQCADGNCRFCHVYICVQTHRVFPIHALPALKHHVAAVKRHTKISIHLNVLHIGVPIREEQVIPIECGTKFESPLGPGVNRIKEYRDTRLRLPSSSRQFRSSLLNIFKLMQNVDHFQHVQYKKRTSKFYPLIPLVITCSSSLEIQTTTADRTTG